MPWFDFVRGLAALAVCSGHLRNLLFKDFAESGGSSGGQKLFYLVSGLGHEAVVVFFVLSGCLVGGTVWDKAGTKAWGWRQYFLARGTRLWIVLIPALVATLLWDLLGLYYFGSSIVYTQADFGHILPAGVWEQHTLGVFLGNLFFLQTIFVVPFGSNGPLWSLANEFWYYLIFPVLVLGWRKRGLGRGAGWLVVGLALLVGVGPKIATYGLIWLLGVAVAVVIKRKAEWPKGGNMWMPWLGLGMLTGGLVVLQLPGIKERSELLKDMILAVLCACALVLLARGTMPRLMAKVSAGLSNVSYTLYLAHLPLAVFLVAWALGGQTQRLGWSGEALGVYALILSAVITYAVALYFIFERRTDMVRGWLAKVWIR